METLMCKGRNWLSMEVCDPDPRASNHYPLLPVRGDVRSPAGSLLKRPGSHIPRLMSGKFDSSLPFSGGGGRTGEGGEMETQSG